MVKGSKKVVLVILLAVFTLPSASYSVAQASAGTQIKTASLSETFGAAIIVAGDRSDHELQAQIRYGASKVYDVLVNYRGFPANRVYFLSPANPGGLEPNADAESTYANIQYAFTTWVSSRIDSTHGLVVYFFDHGGYNAMAIPGGNLLDSSVDGWLDTLETTDGLSHTVIVYEACDSGSFMSPLSQSKRIVITSTDATHSAYASSNWAVFSESFWGSIASGDTIGDAFVAGWYNVAKTGHNSVQFPLVDDDYNSIGHGPQVVMVWMLPVAFLPNTGDGNDALNTKINGYDGPLLIPSLKVGKVTRHFYVKYVDNEIPAWVKITNTTPVKDVIVKVTPPQWTPPVPPAPDPEGDHMVQDTGLLNTTLLDHQGDGNYSGSIIGQAGPLPRGDYMLSFYVSSDAGIGDAVYIPATINDDGMAPPDTIAPVVAITTPGNDVNLSGSVNLNAIADDDQGLKNVELYVDNILVENVAMPQFYPYPDITHVLDTTRYANGPHTIVAKAFDLTGLSNSSTITVNVMNPIPPISGFSPVIIIGVIFAGIIWIVSRRRRFNNV